VACTSEQCRKYVFCYHWWGNGSTFGVFVYAIFYTHEFGSRLRYDIYSIWSLIIKFDYEQPCDYVHIVSYIVVN
jgi:hypothetical protein